MNAMRPMTRLTFVLIAMLLVVSERDHGTAHPVMSPGGRSFPTRPARAVRAWSVVAARRLAGVAAGAVRVVTGRLSLFYHVAVIILAAAIAATLPFTFAFLARRLLASWSAIEDEKVFLVSTEIAVALVLVLVLSRARTNWRNRRLSKIARAAGVGHLSSADGILSPRGGRRREGRHPLLRGNHNHRGPGVCPP